nr:hypothetical protein Iba_chr14aCG4720 [Ipomoea batatas]
MYYLYPFPVGQPFCGLCLEEFHHPCYHRHHLFHSQLFHHLNQSPRSPHPLQCFELMRIFVNDEIPYQVLSALNC